MRIQHIFLIRKREGIELYRPDRRGRCLGVGRDRKITLSFDENLKGGIAGRQVGLEVKPQIGLCMKWGGGMRRLSEGREEEWRKMGGEGEGKRKRGGEGEGGVGGEMRERSGVRRRGWGR